MKKLCTIKLFCIFLIIILVIFLFIFLFSIFYKKNRFNNKKILFENFQSTPASTSSTGDDSKKSAWTTNRADAAQESADAEQDKKLKNTITNIVKNQLDQIKATQGSIIKGPAGPAGPQGPAGTTLISAGKLVNKSNSFDSSTTPLNYFTPQYVLTRTGGTDPKYSVSYMDNNSAFASFQDWQYDINNNIISRYDGNCLTMDNNTINQVLYLEKCDSANNNQKWKWDNVSNRLVSIVPNSNPQKVKCIVAADPSGNNTNISNNLNCSGTDCSTSKPIKKIAEVLDCDMNTINDNEVWTFM